MFQVNLGIFQSICCFILCVWKSLERHPAWNWPLEGGIARLLINIVLLELLGDVAVAVIVLIHTLFQLVWLILETQQRDARWEVCVCSWKQCYKHSSEGTRAVRQTANKGLFSIHSIYLKFKSKKVKHLYRTQNDWFEQDNVTPASPERQYFLGP